MTQTTDGRLRVLHVVDTLGVGGTELCLANLVEHTQEQVAHAVCCVRQGGATAERLTARGIPITVLGKADGNEWRLPLRLARVCREQVPHIVHTRNWGTIDGIIGARLARVPVVIHGEHGRDATDPQGTNKRRNRTRRVLSMAVDRVVTVSDQLRSWLVDDVGIRTSKVRVLHNGVDLQRFGNPTPRNTLRAQYGFASTDVVIGTVGRLDPVKNQAALLAATSRMRATHPHLRCVIVGDGPEAEALRHVTDDNGLHNVVHLMGHRDDVPSMLALLDVFVLPSLAEGLCNTILEAMATRLPVIATRVGGNSELVVDGVTGRLIAASDVDALAQAIAFYAGNEAARAAHGGAGHERVLQEFTLDRMVARYIDLYRSETERKRCAA